MHNALNVNSMNKIYKILFVFVLSFLIGGYVSANYCKCNGGNTSYSQSVCSNKSSSEGCQWITDSNDNPVSLSNPLGSDAASKSPQALLGKIINSALGIIGSLALVMFIYGGATWMLSAGNQEQVTKGKNILIWATLGLVIIFTSYALVRFVLTSMTG